MPKNNWGNFTQSHIVNAVSLTGAKVIVFYSYSTPIIIFNKSDKKAYMVNQKYSRTTSKQTSIFKRWLSETFGIEQEVIISRNAFIDLLEAVDLRQSGWL